MPTRRIRMTAPAATAVTPPPETTAESISALAMIRTLVAFDTTSRESNLALIEWVRDWLAAQGVASTLTFDDTRRKANLFATLAARDGNSVRDGVVLSGHTDVVPVDGQPWETNPFEATWVGDRLHGRGVADMKSFCATALAYVPEFLRRGLARPLHLALSYDEEIGCIGVRRMIDDISRRGVAPLGCIVGEPTGMRTVIAHKGKRSWRCRVRGFEAHSSLTPHGVNAVEIACEIVAYLANMARAFREQGPFDRAYDVAWTTVHTGVIQGGTALNIVPRDCSFDFEIRHLPEDDPEELLAEIREYADRFLPAMRGIDPDTFIEFTPLSATPGFDLGGDAAIARLARLCSGEARDGKVSFGSEASLFHRANIPAIVCGPGHIAQAHQPNEWIAREQLVLCETFMRRLSDELCVS
jgi:acetylornithine deacetylase